MASSSARKRIAAGIAAVLGGKIRVPKRPRPYQRDALGAVRDWLMKTTEPRAHLSHATGLGKTVVFSSVASAMGQDRLLVVVPTKPLLVQTARVLSGFSNGQIGHVSSLGRIDDGDGETIATRGIAGSQIVVTTNASLRLKGEQIAREFDPQLVVYDECHWSYTDEIQAALGHFGDTPMLGVTATPDFMGTAARAGYVPVTFDNGQVLWGPRERFAETHFGRRLDERTVRWGIEEGWLAPLAWGRIEFDISLDDLRTQDGVAGADYNEQDLHDLLSRNWSAMVDTIRRLYRSGQYQLAKRQVFSVCHSVDAARELAEAIQGIGVPSACVVGTTGDDERDDILTRYRRDRIRFLSSVMVLREGWDSPNAEVCMMLRPTKSRVLYQQVMGRVLRKLDGRRKVALVLDARFQNTEFSPLSTPILFGKAGSEIPEGDIIVGPREGSGERFDGASPYLPTGAKPRLVVEDALQTEHCSGEEGTIEVFGEVWANYGGIERITGLTPTAFVSKLEKCRSIPGRAINGKRSTFYALRDVREACGDIAAAPHRASTDGTFEADGETWATRPAIAKRLGVSKKLVLRLLPGNCRTRSGRDSSGQMTMFCAISDAIRLLKNHMVQEQAGDDGVLHAKGESWAPMGLLKQLLGLSRNALEPRAKGCRSRPARDRSGVVRIHYSVADVRSACADLLDQSRQAEVDGGFTEEGERWMTTKPLSETLGLSMTTIAARSRSCKVKVGKDRGGRLANFYSVNEMRNACADLIEDLPSADKDGVFDADGEAWGMVQPLSKILGLNRKTISSRVKSTEVRKRFGISTNSVRYPFYCISDVRKVCADLLDQS